jgi:hypothetical protein
MTIRAVVNGHMPGGEVWSNVFHFVGETVTPAEVVAIADGVHDFYDAFNQIMSNQWGADGVVIGLTEPGAGQVEGLWSPVVGESSSPALPNDMAVVISWRTGMRGRSFRGRTYIGGFTSLSLGSGSGKATQVEANHAGNLVDAATVLLDAEGAPPMCVHSRTGAGDTPITGGYVNLTWDTQRRRDQNTPPAPIYFNAID